MKTANQIEQIVRNKRVKTDAILDERILADARDVFLSSMKGKIAVLRPALPVWRVVVKSRITKVAIAAAIIVVGLVILSSQQSLYAQVVKAMEEARTFHAVIKESRGGQWFRDWDIKYDRRLGVVEENRYKDMTTVEIDNGQQQWRYKAEGGHIVQYKSNQKVEEYARKFCEDWLWHNIKRKASGDKVIDGVLCKMYTLSNLGNEYGAIWATDENRVMQFEVTIEECGQEVGLQGVIEYDKPFDADLFSTDFGTDMKVVNPRELIEEYFPLEGAIFKRESLGFVFAVHELKYCGDGFKYLVCSNRLSDETRKEFGEMNAGAYYGQADLFDPENRGHLMLLARMIHDGIRVDWYIIPPSAGEGEEGRITGCNVDVIVTTANQLQEQCEAQGMPIRDKFRLKIPMGEPGEQQPLLSVSEVSREVYSLGSELDHFVQSLNLTEVVTDIDGKMRTIIWRRPVVEMSEEEYIKNIEARVEDWLQSAG